MTLVWQSKSVRNISSAFAQWETVIVVLWCISPQVVGQVFQVSISDWVSVLVHLLGKTWTSAANWCLKVKSLNFTSKYSSWFNSWRHRTRRILAHVLNESANKYYQVVYMARFTKQTLYKVKSEKKVKSPIYYVHRHTAVIVVFVDKLGLCRSCQSFQLQILTWRIVIYFQVASAWNAPLVKHPWLLIHNHTSKRVREIWMKKACCTYFIMAINWPDFPTDIGSCFFLHTANYSLYVCYNEEQVYNAYISPEGADQNNTGDEPQCKCAWIKHEMMDCWSPWSP